MGTLAAMGRVAVLVARMWASDHATAAGCATVYSCQVYSDTLIAGDCNEDDRACLAGEVVTGDDVSPILVGCVVVTGVYTNSDVVECDDDAVGDEPNLTGEGI